MFVPTAVKLFCCVLALIGVVLGSGQIASGCARSRQIRFGQITFNMPLHRNLIAGEAPRNGGIGPGRERVINNDRLPGGVLQVAEIALPLRQRDGERSHRSRALPQALVIEEEERAVLADGPLLPPN